MSFRTLEISNPDHLGGGISFVTVKSAALKRRADISFHVPPGIKAQKLPVVILLHGVYGSHWAWLFKGGAHKVLERREWSSLISPRIVRSKCWPA